MSKARYTSSDSYTRFELQEAARRWLATRLLKGDDMADIDKLADLLDVLLTNPQAGDSLRYDGTKWVNLENSVLKASLILDDTDIRALSTTPAIIIPATRIINYDPTIIPDKIFRPLAATIISKIATDYVVVGANPTIVLGYSSDYANDASEQVGITNGLRRGTWQTDIPCPISLAPQAPSFPNLGVGSQPINGDWLDNALVLAAKDAIISGGNPSNTLTVEVFYSLVSIV